nr:Zinc knuckle family protein [Ipomoea batatas]
MAQEVDVEVNGPTSKQVENEGHVEIDEVDCVHSEEIFRSLDGSDSERECNGPENVFQERNLKKDGFKFVLGMIFRSAYEFKWAVKYHEAMRRKDVKFIKNEGRRVRVCCRQSDICNWTIFGSRSNPRCPFQIKTYNPEHTCGDQDENKTINSGFLAKLYKDDFRVNMDWGRIQFQEHVKQKLHCQVSKHQAYRAKHKVRKELDGADSDQGSQEGVGSQSTFIAAQGTTTTTNVIAAQGTSTAANAVEQLLRTALQRLGRPGKILLIKKKQKKQ